MVLLTVGANVLAQDCKEGKNDYIVTENTYNTEFVYLLRGKKNLRDNYSGREESGIVTFYFDDENKCKKMRYQDFGSVVLCNCERIPNPGKSNTGGSSGGYDIVSRTREKNYNNARIDQENTTSRYFNQGEVRVIESKPTEYAQSNNTTSSPVPKPRNRKQSDIDNQTPQDNDNFPGGAVKSMLSLIQIQN